MYSVAIYQHAHWGVGNAIVGYITDLVKFPLLE